MNIQITFSIPNPDYDQQYADEYHDGKESENNTRQNWAVGYPVENVSKIIEEMNTDFRLKGQLDNSNYLIPNLRIIRFITSDLNQFVFAISEELIQKNIEIRPRKNGDKYYYIYLNPHVVEGSDFIRPVDGFFISRKDIPKVEQ